MTKPRKKRRHGTPRSPSECTPMERAFVDAYVGEAAGNGALAARMAGYSDRADACKVRAAVLLGRERVQVLLETQRAEREQLEREAAELARSDKLAKLVKAREDALTGGVLTTHQRRLLWSAIAMGEIEGTTVADRIRASELLGKADGDFNHVRRVRVGLDDVDDDDLWAELVATRRAAGKLLDAAMREVIEVDAEARSLEPGDDEEPDDAT